MSRVLAAALAILVAVVANAPSATSADTQELAALDLEGLMEVEVVSASRRVESLTSVAGAVSILNEEDIFHSGATTIPDALKLLPGVHVVQMDIDRWGVGIRGFNGLLSNKHLVLVDGRPITSPTTGDVSWGNLIPIANVKRIELVRGPWAHLWGADSFTGVINIITKTAAETQGAQAVTLLGTSGAEQGGRYGGAFGSTGYYRMYGRGGLSTENWSSEQEDKKGSEDWRRWQAGTRIDWENAFTDSLSFQADFVASGIYDGAGGSRQVYKPHERNTVGGYGQFTWNRALGLDSGINFRTSYTLSGVRVGDLKGDTNTLDAEIQHAVEQAGIHRLTWGMAGRYFWDTLQSGENTRINRENRYTFSANGFVQDRLTLVENSLYLTFGAKLDYFGERQVEVQPSVRLLHTRDNKEYWLAMSRAVRADTRWQRSGSYFVNVRGNTYTVNAPDSLATEKMTSLEVGHRRRFSPALQWDTSAYVNRYDELVSLIVDKAARTGSLSNSLKGTAVGFESLLEWDAADWLMLSPMASIIYQDIDLGDLNLMGESMPEEGFMYELKLQSRFKTSDATGLDILVGYIDGPTDKNIPGYFCLEAHAYWRPSDSLMLEFLGRNLGETTEQFSTLRVGPSADLRMTWDF